MGNSKTSPETGSVAAVEEEELGWRLIVERARHTDPQVVASPTRAEPLAFEAEVGNFIEGIDRSQTGVELQAVDNSNRVLKPNMLGAQIAVAIDKTSLEHTMGEEPCATIQKSTLRPIDAADLSTGKREARVEQNAAVVRQAPLPFGQVRRRGDRDRLGPPVEPAKAHHKSVKLPGIEAALEYAALEHAAFIQPTHHDQPIDDRASTAYGKTF